MSSRAKPAGSSLGASEAAQRLGVSLPTLYAYVSRGFLHPHRAPGERASLFDPREVDQFARRPRRRRRTGTARPTPLEVTRISGGKLWYRDRDACQLAREMRFEQAVEFLWTGDDADLHGGWQASEPHIDAARRVQRLVPDDVPPSDRLPLIVEAVALSDPLRSDTSEPAVLTTARSLLRTMVAALPTLSGRRAGSSLAEQLWIRLTPAAPTPALLEVLDAALVLLADHGARPPATRAAILAASAGSDPYAVVLAAMAVGSRSHLGRPFLSWQNTFREIGRADAGLRVVAERLRRGDRVPGFQRRQYSGPDPRATLLLEMLGERLGSSAALAGMLRLIDVIRARQGLDVNVEVAVAAFAALSDMSPDAGEAIFTVARSAGWLAHAIETYRAGPSAAMPTFLDG